MRGIRFLAAAAMFAAPGSALAQFVPYTPPAAYQPYAPPAASYGPRTTYDWQSGNMYTTTPHYDGGASVRGSNLNTGSMWNTTIQPNGDMRGTDAQGNMWTYNRSTGAYMNTNGHGCFGRGAARSCY